MDKVVVADERRWARRRSLDLDADVTDTAGLSYVAKVTDLSTEGCSLRIVSGGELVRDRLQTIKITGLEPISAYVIWSSNDKVGLVLSKPLKLDLVENLVIKSAYARLCRRLTNIDQSKERLQNLRPFRFD